MIAQKIHSAVQMPTANTVEGGKAPLDARGGTFSCRPSSVTAMANTPSLNASSLPVSFLLRIPKDFPASLAGRIVPFLTCDGEAQKPHPANNARAC